MFPSGEGGPCGCRVSDRFRRFGVAPVSPHRTAQSEANACRNGCGRPDLERSGRPEYGAALVCLFRSNGRERYISYGDFYKLNP